MPRPKHPELFGQNKPCQKNATRTAARTTKQFTGFVERQGEGTQKPMQLAPAISQPQPVFARVVAGGILTKVS